MMNLKTSKTKSLKIVNSKFQNSKRVLLWRPLRRKFRRSLERFKSDLRDKQHFEVFAHIGYNDNGNEEKIIQNRKLKNSKIQNSTFVRATGKQNSEKFWNDSKVIWGRSSFLKPLLPYGPRLTKTKKKIVKNWKKHLFSKIQKPLGVWPRASNNWNLK